MQGNASESLKLDDMEFGKRIAIERDIEKSGLQGGQAATCNAVFDETGNYILYPTLLGIKIVNIHTNKLSLIVGKQENIRFMNLALYQGAPKRKTVKTLEMAASENVALQESEETDPTIICTAFRKNRFYLFTRREPDSSSGSGGRDIFNEKPTRDEQTLAATILTKDVSTAIIHTTFGDIYIKLFPQFAPKACKNFIEHAKSGRTCGFSHQATTSRLCSTE
ncbi:hypothetical protein HDU91_007304 [Kappamyces sp. JEL0680]|nr:hypothetical protein HDU91_007304 [Kappamyces sp. JEL0680]